MVKQEEEMDKSHTEAYRKALEGKFCKCKTPYPGMYLCRSCDSFFKSQWVNVKNRFSNKIKD